MVPPFPPATRRVLGFVVALAAACGGGGGDGPPATAASVAIVEPGGGTASGVVGSSGTYRVRISDASGTPIRGTAVAWNPSAGTAAPASSVTDASGIASTTWTLGTTVGAQTLRASSGSAPSATFTATATADRAASIAIARDTTIALIPGASVRFSATVRDRYGNPVAATVRWSTSDVDLAAIDSLGNFIAFNPGSLSVLATADTAHGASAVTIARPAPFTVTSVATDTLTPGASLVVDGAGFTPSGMTATIAGYPAVVNASATRLTIGVPSLAVIPCAPPSIARVVIRRQLGAVVDSFVTQAPLDPATTIALQPGERLVPNTDNALRCTRLENGGQYVVSVFNANTAAPGGLAVQLRGRATNGLLASRAPIRTTTPRAQRPPRDSAAAIHVAHLERERARLTSLGSPTRALAMQRARAPIGARALAVPNVGDVTTLNAMYYDCAVPTAVRARVVAVGTRSVVLEDMTAPGAGTRDQLYRDLADEYDRVMHPIVTTYFGDPLALDAKFGGDGRVRILLTPYVSDSVPNTIGFMTGCNFYARTQLASSNELALFYARLPNAVETPTEWRRNLRATLVHEAKHLAAYAERFARAGTGTPVLEETWLEESTARVAEELYARTFSGATWKGNAPWASTVGCEVTSCDGRPLAMYKHFAAVADYYSRVDSLTPLGRTSPFDGTFYGSGWLLVRWTADQYATDEASFFRALTTETTATGIANLVRRAVHSAPDLVADWSLALAVDDRPGFAARTTTLAIPSWNTRDVMKGLNGYNAFQFPRPFPLLERLASFGDFTVSIPLLRSYTAAYVELAGATGARQLLSLEALGGGAPPPNVGLAIVRVQ